MQRPANALVAGYSYLHSSMTKRHYVRGFPVAVSAELTNQCNLKCPECPTGSGTLRRPKGFMDISLFEKIISELGPYLYNINLHFQGEPMLHPDFFSFLEKCMDLNSVVSTNGHFITEENAGKIAMSGLRKLIISLDGMDSETYSLYRKNGDFVKIIEGIRDISAAKKRYSSGIRIVIQFLVSRHNENQIDKARAFARETGCELSLKSMQVIHEGSTGYWMPSDKRFRRYEKEDNGYALRNSLPDRCARAWLNPVVTWEGNVLPCCFDKDAGHIMGNLNEESFSEIWDGPRFRLFRKSILAGRYMNEICRNCTSGLRGVIT